MRFETSNRLKFKIFILLLSSTIDKNSMNDNSATYNMIPDSQVFEIELVA